MNRKILSGLMLAMLLVGMSTLAFNIQQLKASGTIYIRPDGSIDPSNAPIRRDGDIYTFTNNITDEIVVQRSNVVVDGAYYTLQGPDRGVLLDGRKNVTVKNANIRGCSYGIYLANCSNINIFGNSIAQIDEFGIYLTSSNNSAVMGNNITECSLYAISLEGSSNHNSIIRNNLENDWYGISLYSDSSNNRIIRNNMRNVPNGITLMYSCCFNRIYHNNFINVSKFDITADSVGNVWDDDYPSGGNYWSNYVGTDNFWGENQNLNGGDLIGDTAYVISEDNRDRYPLLIKWWDKPPITVFPDLNDDGKVNIIDIYIVAKHFGEELKRP
jgi:parallel beta-helix repeat protein